MENIETTNLMKIKEASIWASKYLGKNVTSSNIAYLVQYGRIPNHGDNGNVSVNRADLKEYYRSNNETKEDRWKKKLGSDLNWDLSFSQYSESETTKHVHRLHPYKGKFIPQLVEYFLDDHTDNYKKEPFFSTGDIVLDPFCGCGTTLVQANELGLHAVGIDVSSFNAFICNIKTGEFDLNDAQRECIGINRSLRAFQFDNSNVKFEQTLLEELKVFNAEHFPAPEFRYKVAHNEIDEKSYSDQKSKSFLKIYFHLINEFKIPLEQVQSETFLDKWYLQVVRNEIDFVFAQIKLIKNSKTKRLLQLILSRTIRSCRATTHSDLGTLRGPVTTTYYCKKHGKICKPLFSIFGWWQRYSSDTIKRVAQFNKLRTNTFQKCLVGDSRLINIQESLNSLNVGLPNEIKQNKISGIFSSPPYVGLINYHDQHAYAYDLYGIERRDELEIGPLQNGKGKEARESYVKGISDVLNNCKQFLKHDYNVFLVANDQYNLYPQIAELSKMKIVNTYKRPVLNRVEKSRSAYSEIIFHLRNL
ncbi:MAG: DNA methyltransferase [Candidatus Hatepunaea meridiana]|nr:DNA methyltransferase [Candidatus Hatepunaea meridiana]